MGMYFSLLLPFFLLVLGSILNKCCFAKKIDIQVARNSKQQTAVETVLTWPGEGR